MDTVLWLCPSLPTETLKWLSSLPILMQKSFWWWQCSDTYIISLYPHLHTSFPPCLLNLLVSSSTLTGFPEFMLLNNRPDRPRAIVTMTTLSKDTALQLCRQGASFTALQARCEWEQYLHYSSSAVQNNDTLIICNLKRVFIQRLHLTWTRSAQNSRANKIFTEGRAQWNRTNYVNRLQHHSTSFASLAWRLNGVTVCLRH